VDPQPLAIHRSRTRIAPFRLHRVASLAEAGRILAAEGSAARVMAGGVDLVNLLKHGAPIGHLIYLPSIGGLSEPREEGGDLVIPCLATHRDLMRSPLVARRLPDLPPLWRAFANPRIRAKGTIIGNLLADNPQYDAALVMQTLGACVEWAEDAPGLAAALRLASPPGTCLLYDRRLRPAISVALSVLVADGMASNLRLGFGCAFPSIIARPLLLPGPVPLAALPSAAKAPLAEVLAGLPPALSTFHAGAAYRREMAGVLAARLIRRLATEAVA
jgi:carbon-monoxide dehydrogenase medium subunit